VGVQWWRLSLIKTYCRAWRPACCCCCCRFLTITAAAAYRAALVVGVPLVQKLYRMLMSTGIITVLVCDFQFFFPKKSEA
jgi:hypothetical protein